MAIIAIDLGIKGIKAGMTNRHDGYSLPPYARFNLGTHVGDDLDAVMQNRAQFYRQFPSQAQFQWLNQIHSADCVPFTAENNINADAILTNQPLQICLVQTADCIPILITDGDRVSAIHSGWKGVLAGVIERTLVHFTDKPITVFLGVAISAKHFQVGEEVRQQFITKNSDYQQYFQYQSPQRYLCDLKGIVENIIQQYTKGCHIINYADCSYANHDYFSYRRGGVTGRMATFIYKE